MKKIGLLFATIVMIMLFALSASAATEGIYTYEIVNEEAIIIDVPTSTKGAVNIPSTLGAYPVTTIGRSAFEFCRSITSVTIPETVKTIEKSAFWGCDNLKSVNIPKSVTFIGDNAFIYCGNLKGINVALDNTEYSSDERGILFNKDKTVIIQYPLGISETSYIIPDGVTIIYTHAFCDSDKLTNITLPDSVTTIGDSAFYASDGLVNITIGKNVKVIDRDAFRFCTNLKSVTIPDSVTTIGSLAFDACSNLTSIIVGENNTSYSSDEQGVLFNKNKTTLIKYPEGNIAKTYVIPNGVFYIDSHAFDSCNNLTIVTISEGVKSIGFAAFDGCKNLATVNIPNSVTSIGGTAFNNCTKLINITIPENVTTIGSHTFFLCSSLKSINIPKKVTYIGEYAFYACDSLANVYYDSSEEDWEKITIKDYNDCLKKAKIHFTYDCPRHVFSSTVVSPTCTAEGYTVYKCECGYSYTSDYVGTKAHTYTVSNIVDPTCESKGYTVYVCQCGHSYNGDAKSATGHNYNGDSCVNCGESKVENCSCNCHKSGISGFFWKILRFFYKLFGTNKTCGCGVAHY